MKAFHVLPLVLVTFACGGGDPKPPQRPAPPAVAIAPVVDAGPPAEADPLGPRPGLSAPAPFTPPVPVVYKGPHGVTVWMVERHGLPIVSVDVVVASGAARDPQGKAGLSWATANMLDEGAGTRGALDLARDVDRLGATLHTSASADAMSAQLTVLKKNLAAGTAILADVIGKPQFSAVEWKRVHNLWMNDLKARQSEPREVANVVVFRQVYGAAHPYGHPTDGTLKTAASVTLDDVKKLYAETWGSDTATIVVVGDVTRAELDPLLDKALGGFKEARKGAKPAAAPASPVSEKRRVIVVDRPDAPQSVIALARPGLAAADVDAPVASRANNALGGSFTSRLNQDLREEHGWSYGAHSRFTPLRYTGLFVAESSVQTEHTGDALKAMLGDVENFAGKGLVDEEIDKTRLTARGDLVEQFEGVEATARRFARDIGAGLPPDYDAKSAGRMDAATKSELSDMAAKYMDPAKATIVIVGPRAKIEPQLKAIGIGGLETASPEGE